MRKLIEGYLAYGFCATKQIPVHITLAGNQRLE